MTNKKTTTITTIVNGHKTVQKTVVAEDPPAKENYFSENFFKTVAAALTGLGLLVIYAYHFSIEYYPVFDLKSAASLIFAAAYSGFFLVAIIASFILGAWLLCLPFIYEKLKGATSTNISALLFPYFVAAFSSFLLLFCIATFSVLQWLGWLVPVAFIVLVWRMGFDRGGPLVFICLLQTIPFLILGQFLIQSDKLIDDQALLMAKLLLDIVVIDLLIQCCGIYVLIAWFSPILLPRHKASSILAVCVAIFLMTVLTRQQDFLGARVADITKFGNFYAAELTLSKEGCKAVNTEGDRICTGTEESGFKMCGVYVVSRLGAESYLKRVDTQMKAPEARDTKKTADWFTKRLYVQTKDILGMRVYARGGSQQRLDTDIVTAALKCPKANQPKTKESISLGGKEFFELDKAVLGASGKVMLVQLAEKLAAMKDTAWTATVYGYSDQLGTPQYNEKLSRERAQAVADFLIRRLPEAKDRIKPPAPGSAKPTKTEAQCPPTMAKPERIECLAENRRAEIQIITQAPAT